MKLNYYPNKGWAIVETEEDCVPAIVSPSFGTPEEALTWAVNELADQAGFVLEFDGPSSIMLKEKYI